KSHAPLESTLYHVVVVGVLGVWMLMRRSSRVPARLLLAVVLGYALLSTRLAADVLVWGLGHGLTSIQDHREAHGADTIVVLGSGVNTYQWDGQVAGALTEGSALRALEGARVFKVIGAQLLIASGGIPHPEYVKKPESELIRVAAVGAGVPADRVLEESTSK